VQSPTTSPRRGTAAMDYLRIRPLAWEDARRLTRCYLFGLGAYATRRKQFRGLGGYLPGPRPVGVRLGTAKFWIRPRSEDLRYVLPANKPFVDRHFHPKPGETVVDVGAHIGQFSVRAGIAGASVVAIEPNPSTFATLTANLELNRIENARPMNVALGAAPGSAQLHSLIGYEGFDSLDSEWTASFPRLPAREYTVPVTTLDRVVTDLSISEIDWLLVDVEGTECDVLRGGEESLRHSSNVIVEVSGDHLDACSRELFERHSLRPRAREQQTPLTEYWFAIR
jgi:FkbM family methyltransferase